MIHIMLVVKRLKRGHTCYLYQYYKWGFSTQVQSGGQLIIVRILNPSEIPSNGTYAHS